MSVGENSHLNGKAYLRATSETSKVDLNDLMGRVKEEEKKARRNNLAISAVALSAAAVFGIILTL